MKIPSFLKLRPSMRWEDRKRLLRYEAWGFLLLAWLAIAYAYLFPANLDSNSTLYGTLLYVAFMVRVFQFHIGLVLAGLAVICLVARAWKLAIAALPLLLLLLGPEIQTYLRRVPQELKTNEVVAMTMNLFEENTSYDAALREIRSIDPHILLLQEYTVKWHVRLLSDLEKDYPYRLTHPEEDPFGAAIYSKLPFTGETSDEVYLSENTPPQMKVSMEVITDAGTTASLIVYNIHTLPPSGVGEFMEQRQQLATLADLLSQDEGAVLVGGDFNLTDRTEQSALIENQAFMPLVARYGVGRCRTWPCIGPLRCVPGIRLDHIYLRSGIGVAAGVSGPFGSDHKAAWARFKLSGSP